MLKYAILKLGEGVVRNVVGSAIRSCSSWIGVGLKTQVACRKGHQGYPTGCSKPIVAREIGAWGVTNMKLTVDMKPIPSAM